MSLPTRRTGRLIKAIACFVAVTLLSLYGNRGGTQEPAPPGSDLVAFAAKRFPQPVRVGDLLNRPVLRPTESRVVLGYVTGVIRLSNGSVQIVMTYGGYFGVGSRTIAVPVEGMALLGAELEVLDFTPGQLSGFPAFDGTAAEHLSADQSISMGLARPSH